VESGVHEGDACSRLFDPDAFWDPKEHRPEVQLADERAPKLSFTVYICGWSANSAACVSMTGEYCTQQRPDKIPTEQYFSEITAMV